MAFRLFCMRAYTARQSMNVLTGVSHNVNGNISSLLRPNIIQQHPKRPNTFFTKLPAEMLWKSVTSVSNAGKRRGRGKRGSKKLARNLNKGQFIGVGKVKMLWPGLNSPVLQGSHLVRQNKISEDTTATKNLQNLMEDLSSDKPMRISRRQKIHPLERGWTSATMCGRSLGPPDPIRDQKFENFDTKVIEFKIVNCMTNNLGRTRKFSCFTITGNKNGLIGFALKKSSDARSSMQNAKNRAGQKLMYIDRCDGHTIYHDFFTSFGHTKIFVSKKPEGYGVIAHRAIKECCELIGIKNLYAKVEGSTNVRNIVKAFLLGLIKQRTYKQLAEEKKLHLVEFKAEHEFYPKVVASPSTVRTKEEVEPNEIMDFTQYVLDGKILLKRQKQLPFYMKKNSWIIRMRKDEYLRNQRDVRLRMYMEHGMLRSFLTDKYPDAIPQFWKKNREEVTEE